jgi:acetolactate synthase-1/2/3 large subunit
VLNNRGYVSIKQTQDTFFAGHRVACDPDTGVSFPDIRKVASAYGIDTERIDRHASMGIKIAKVLKHKGPIVCEVILNPEQEFMPRLKSEKRPDGSIVSKPLEDMYPFLADQELRENTIRS